MVRHAVRESSQRSVNLKRKNVEKQREMRRIQRALNFTGSEKMGAGRRQAAPRAQRNLEEENRPIAMVEDNVDAGAVGQENQVEQAAASHILERRRSTGQAELASSSSSSFSSSSSSSASNLLKRCVGRPKKQMAVNGAGAENIGVVDFETPTDAQNSGRGRSEKAATSSEIAPTPEEPSTSRENKMAIEGDNDGAGAVRSQLGPCSRSRRQRTLVNLAHRFLEVENRPMAMREDNDDARKARGQNHEELPAIPNHLATLAPSQILEKRQSAGQTKQALSSSSSSSSSASSSSSSSASILLTRDVGRPKKMRVSPQPQAVATPEERIETDEGMMNSATVCCDERDLQYHAANVLCSFNGTCRIAPGQTYWKAKNGDKYNACLKCFKTIGEERAEYVKAVNINTAVEEILTCSRCSDRYHKCCSFFYGTDNSSFVCNKCDKTAMVRRTVSAKQKCKLANFISKKLNNLLEQVVDKETASRHPFRVVGFSAKKATPIEDFSPILYEKEFKKVFTKVLKHLSRALYVFQRIDGVDVISFALFSLECDWKEGKKLCEIDYIDSVPYFKTFDNLKRGAIHEAIILGFYEYMSSIGYGYAPLWANPAIQFDDYAFHIHPIGMKFLNGNELIGYYQRMHKSGVTKGIIKTFNDFEEENKDGKFDSPEKIPIFPGSLWSIIMKDIEEELDGNEKSTDSIQLKKQFWRKLKRNFPPNGKNNFFITLPVPATIEEADDETNSHKVLEDRIEFVEKCAEENWEFVNLRRAKFASVGAIQMLGPQEEDEEQEESE